VWRLKKEKEKICFQKGLKIMMTGVENI